MLLRIDPRDYLASRDQAKASLDSAKGQVQSSKFGVEVAKQNLPGAAEAGAGRTADGAGTGISRRDRLSSPAQHRARRDDAAGHRLLDRFPRPGQGAGARGAGPGGAGDPGDAADLHPGHPGQSAICRGGGGTGGTRPRQPQPRMDHDPGAQRRLDRAAQRRARHLRASGQQLFSIVEPDVWITANFKENQLTRMRAGQPVRISVDAYPDLQAARPRRQHPARLRLRVHRLPARERDRQLRQDRAARAGQDRHRQRPRPAAPLPLGISVEPTVDVR